MCEGEPRALPGLSPLQLAEGGEQGEHEFPARRGRVDVAAGQTELCPGAAEAVGDFDGVPGGSGEPGQVVGDQNTLGPACVGEGCLEARPIVGSLAADTLIGVDGDQLPSVPT